jgi:hypothetical protein
MLSGTVPVAQENHIAGFVKEPQRTQLPNLPIIRRWLKTEIELLEVFSLAARRMTKSKMA